MDELPSPDSQQPDTTQATDHSVQASDLSSQNFVCPAEPEGKCCPESIASLQQDTHVCGAEIRLGSGFDIGRAVSITEKTPRSEFVEKWLEGTTDAFAPRGSVREKALLVRLPQQSGPLSSTQRTEQNMSSSSNRRAWIDSLGNIHWSTKSRRDSSSNKHDDRVYSRGREGSVLPQSSPNSKGHTVRFSGSTRGGDGGGGGGSSCSRGHRRGRHSSDYHQASSCLNLEGRYGEDGRYTYYDIGHPSGERRVVYCMHGFVPQLCERCEHTSYGKGRGRGRSRDRSRPRSRHRRRRRISCSTCTSTDSCDSCRGGHRRPREGGRRSTETSRRRDSDRGHGRGRNSKRDAEVRCYGHGGPGLDVSYGYDYGYGYDWGRHGTSRRGGQSAASRLGEDAPAEYFRMAEDAARVQRQAARQARWLFGEYGR